MNVPSLLNTDDTNNKTKLTLAPESVLDNIDHKPRCMFVKECTTGSQLRKAISHIFGRNKICTRQIPENIWVHFCRKHYQRCRYRNATEYAKLQCQLVIKQIQRVQAWSDRNEAKNELGVVTGWTLGIRKREQKRLASQNDPNAARPPARKRPPPFCEFPGTELEDHRRAREPRAVPRWLQEKCGKNFTTLEVIDLFGQIGRELDQDTMREIPDIEILPSITHDPNEEIQYKRYEKRKNVETQMLNGSSHSHSQPAVYPWQPIGREVSQYQPSSSGHGFWSASGGTLGTGGTEYQYEKRQRVGDFGGDSQRQDAVVPRSEHRTVPEWRSGPSYLRAPVAQRLSAQSTAQQLEETDFPAFSDRVPRQPHQRSQSDVSGFRYLPPVCCPEPWPSRLAGTNSPNSSKSSTHSYAAQRTASSYYAEPGPRQSSHGQSFGAGTNGNLYSGSAYGGGGCSGHTPSYSDFPPQQQHPSFTAHPGAASYYNPMLEPLPSWSGRQRHARHQSTPTFSQPSQQTYGPAPSFQPAVAPLGYSPAANHTDNHAGNRVENHADNHVDNSVDNHVDSHAANHAANHTGEYMGDYPANIAGGYTSNHTGNHTGNHTDNHTGNHMGNHTGDHTGSYADSQTGNHRDSASTPDIKPYIEPDSQPYS